MHQTLHAADARGRRHAPATILLHWLTAVLVVLLWIIGQTIDLVPNGALRVDYRSVHIVFGIALAILVLARLARRWTRQAEFPPAEPGPLAMAARLTHMLLYVLLVSVVALGIATALVRGESIFNLFNLPQPWPIDRAMRRQIGGWHELAANAVLIVAGLHAAAALFHHTVLRDATLVGMLPWARR